MDRQMETIYEVMGARAIRSWAREGAWVSNTPSPTEWESCKCRSKNLAVKPTWDSSFKQIRQDQPLQHPPTPDDSPERHECMPRKGEQMGTVPRLARLHAKPLGHHQIIPELPFLLGHLTLQWHCLVCYSGLRHALLVCIAGIHEAIDRRACAS